MTQTAKVWDDIEREPPDGTLSNSTSAPPNWFREDPRYAAELYALERYPRSRDLPLTREVFVKDTEGKLHRFSVTVRRTIEAFVREMY